MKKKILTLILTAEFLMISPVFSMDETTKGQNYTKRKATVIPDIQEVQDKAWGGFIVIGEDFLEKTTKIKAGKYTVHGYYGHLTHSAMCWSLPNYKFEENHSYYITLIPEHPLSGVRSKLVVIPKD